MRLPAPLTASGLAMLAALPAPQVRALWPSRRALVRRHDAGPASLTELRALLVAVRRTGYAFEDGYVTPGFASVAAAVLDHNAHPLAAVALTFPADEVDAAARAALARRVVAAAGDRRGATSAAARPRRPSPRADPRRQGASRSSAQPSPVRAVAQAVVEAALAALPELDRDGLEEVAAPVLGPRHVAPREPRLGLRDAALEVRARTR